jgi:uncharacterized protein YpmB
MSEILIGNEKVEDWGVFVENDKGETFEIQLSQELVVDVWDFIKKNVNNGKINSIKLGRNTDGRIEW